MIDTITGVNREVAKELNLPEDLVKKVNSFYWKQGIKGSIQSGEYSSVWIKGIGTFATSRNKINIKILKVIREIRYFRNSDKEFKKKTREEYIEEKMNQLRLLLIRRNEIAKVYKFNSEKRKQRKDEATKSKAIMGKQAPNSNGDS